MAASVKRQNTEKSFVLKNAFSPSACPHARECMVCGLHVAPKGILHSSKPFQTLPCQTVSKFLIHTSSGCVKEMFPASWIPLSGGFCFTMHGSMVVWYSTHPSHCKNEKAEVIIWTVSVLFCFCGGGYFSHFQS